MISVMLAALAMMTFQQAAPSALEQAEQAQVETYAFARPNPGIHFSPSGGARYGMMQGCVPHVMTGRPAREFFRTAASSRDDTPGRHTVTSAITLLEDANGACTLIVSRGDPEGLREEMLKVFDESGARRTVRNDTGAGSQDSGGSFRQELHCLTLNGRPLYLVMSSSSASNRPKLMATLGADAGGECARH